MSENILQVRRIVKEGITISTIDVRSKWGGIVFDNFMPDTYTKDRMHAFCSHKQNRGKIMKLEFDITFDHYDKDMDYMDDICDVETRVFIRFDDMKNGTYTMTSETKFGEPLKKFFDDCIDIRKDAFNIAFEKMIYASWKEFDVDYFLEYEFKEKIGEQVFSYDLIDEVKRCVADECKKCVGL